MAFNLRQRVERDLETTLEGGFSLPVSLIAPDGEVYDTKKSDPLTPLTGLVLYNRKEYNPETGEDIMVPSPVVTLRRSSLERIPADGEKWAVLIPIDPDPEADKKEFIFYARPAEGGRAIGYIRIYPQEAEQA